MRFFGKPLLNPFGIKEFACHIYLSAASVCPLCKCSSVLSQLLFVVGKALDLLINVDLQFQAEDYLLFWPSLHCAVGRDPNLYTIFIFQVVWSLRSSSATAQYSIGWKVHSGCCAPCTYYYYVTCKDTFLFNLRKPTRQKGKWNYGTIRLLYFE